MKVRLFVVGVGLALAVFTATPVRADFIYDGDGQMFVTQKVLNNDWVQIKIDVLTTKPFNLITGGFLATGGAEFHQDPADRAFVLGGEMDTAFVGPTGQILDFGSVDSFKELSTEGATQLGSDWGPVNTRYLLAQLVVSTAGVVRAFNADDTEVVDGLVLYDETGTAISTIRGSMSAVPEPSSIALSLIGCGCGVLGLVIRRRRQRRA